MNSNKVKYLFVSCFKKTLFGSHLSFRGFQTHMKLQSNVEPIICKQLLMEKYGEPHEVVKMETVALPCLQSGEVSSNI